MTYETVKSVTIGNLQLAVCLFKLLVTFVLYPQKFGQKNLGAIPHSLRRWHFKLFFHLYCRLQFLHVHGFSISFACVICTSHESCSVLLKKFKIFGFAMVELRVSTVPVTCCVPLSPFINDSKAKDAIFILQFMLLVFWLVVSVSGSWIFVIESPGEPVKSIWGEKKLVLIVWKIKLNTQNQLPY